MDELKRCPFCGAEAYVIQQDFGIQEHKDVRYSISCTGSGKGCGWTFFFCETRQEAIDAWNRRAELVTSQLSNNDRINTEIENNMISLINRLTHITSDPVKQLMMINNVIHFGDDLKKTLSEIENFTPTF